VRTLEDAAYTGWYVLEQDTSVASEDPAPDEGPAEDVRRSLEYVLALLGRGDA
jgi:sugar phosphate isomerase/epimerase